MEYTDKEFCLEIWGPMACFTRPELKVERVSYDVITPSAARAIFEAIFWKPAIRWQITKIEVLNPIKWTSVRRNEVGAVASKNPIFIEDKRQQKNTLCLKDVRKRLIYCEKMKTLQSIIPCLSVVPVRANASISHIWAHASVRAPLGLLIQKRKNLMLLSVKIVTLGLCSMIWILNRT